MSLELKLNIKQIAANLIRALRAQLVPMVFGSPAGGKSSVVKQVAKNYKLKVIDLRLGQCDPCDLLGFPSIDPETKRGYYAPMDTFPLAGDPIPEGYKGWLLFLDEFNSADRSVQKAAYKLVLDRMVGQFHLHEAVFIVCAGNLETDNAIVEEMSTALQSRLVHLEMEIDHQSWMEWALKNGIDHRITAFINFRPNLLYTFSPDHTDRTYASPRTWHFASDIIVDEPKLSIEEHYPILAGTLSMGVAREFIVFSNIFDKLITIPQIMANPNGVTMPDEPSVLYALSGSLSAHMKTEHMDKLMPFIMRMPIEFQVLTIREAVARNTAILQEPSIQNWVAHNAAELY